MAALLSTSARVALRSGASASFKSGAAGLTFARGKATLPDLSCKLRCLGVFGTVPAKLKRKYQPTDLYHRRLWRT
jgi:hypothetical protein